MTKTHASVNVHVSAFDTREGNAAAIDVFHDHYGPLLENTLGPQVTFRWHAGQDPESDRVSIIRDGEGYDDGDPTTIGDWLASTAILWLTLVRDNPIPDLASQVQDRLARSGSPALDVNPQRTTTTAGQPHLRQQSARDPRPTAGVINHPYIGSGHRRATPAVTFSDERIAADPCT